MQTSLAGWSKLSGTHEFSTSDDCATITGTSGDAYYATGNFMYNPSRGANCQYWNRNCDMDASTLQCHTCRDNMGRANQPGDCTHRVGEATSRNPMHVNNCHHWWNRFPSIPTKQNRFCIALKELAPPSCGFTCTGGYTGTACDMAASAGCTFQPVVPFADMRPEFWDKHGRLSNVEHQTFSASIGNGRSVVMTGWTHTRDYHFGFLRNQPGTATATVTGLTPSKSYSYSLYQYLSTARPQSWVD